MRFEYYSLNCVEIDKEEVPKKYFFNSPITWETEDSFQQEEIPYLEFCRRRRISKIRSNNNDNTRA